MTQASPASRPALPGISLRSFRHVLAVAIGLAASSVLAQSIISTTDGQAPTEPPGNTTTTTGQPLSDQGISGELMHTLLGLYMTDADGTSPLQEVSDAYPADNTTWQRQENPNPAWPVVAAYQHYWTAGGQNPDAETDRTPDGHFLLARSNFQYAIVSFLRRFNPDLPQGKLPADFMYSNASVPVQVNDTGIVLGNTMHLDQDTHWAGPREYELEAGSARSIARTDIVPFDAAIQTYRSSDGWYELSVMKGNEPRQVKLCWENFVGSIHRTICQVWHVPVTWTFGKALNFDRVEIQDDRKYFPGDPSEGGFMFWVSGPQTWKRL